ncbi:Glyoxalase/Bleomycin resistance protein/Dihydroxybiphenyl dioxygenase [Bisporella sp. PMI_857]|nr:Glyoxalase/Bleomycin resistance protein/Dihydroxybiphenyl dioxygenase [Bisporella sp. PMI_857]
MSIQPHKKQNSVFNHVAISVPSVEEAADWYQEVFGFRRIRSDRFTDRAVSPDGPIFRIYPPSLNKVNGAWMSCGNGVGFEIFEFRDPKHEKARDFETQYYHGGFFHIAVTVSDPDATVKLASELGGKQIGETCDIYGEKALYLQDPWGNIIECLSCSFEQLMGNRG